MRRLLFTITFAAACIAIGFYMATGFETPARVHAQQFDAQVDASPASNIPLLNSEGYSPFVQVAEEVKPVVVNITAEKKLAADQSTPLDLFDWGPFFGEPPRKNPMRIPTVTSGGSGIIIDREGYILTNNHVISDATDITVKFSDKGEYSAEIIGSDPETDVALIKVDKQMPDNMVARLGDSDQIRIGEWAIAIGNPFGLDWTVTVGVISARGRSNLHIGGGNAPSFQNFIQTDASINYGNSGGPLLNIKGEVIGLNTAINAQGQGIGFAIPINLARKVMDQLRENGEVKRGYLGLYPTELDEIKREALGIDPDIKGVFIDSVQEETPADEGGLKGGEVIISIDGKPLKDVTDFRFRIAAYEPGAKVKMNVWQDGKIKDMWFKLGDRAEYIRLASRPVKKQEQYWLGIEVASSYGQSDMKNKLDKTEGVFVTGVRPESPAEGLLEPGDIIVEIGGNEIVDMEDYHKAAEELKDRKKAIPFWVIRQGRRTFIPIRP